MISGLFSPGTHGDPEQLPDLHPDLTALGVSHDGAWVTIWIQ